MTFILCLVVVERRRLGSSCGANCATLPGFCIRILTHTHSSHTHRKGGAERERESARVRLDCMKICISWQLPSGSAASSRIRIPYLPSLPRLPNAFCNLMSNALGPNRNHQFKRETSQTRLSFLAFTLACALCFPAFTFLLHIFLRMQRGVGGGVAGKLSCSNYE